MKKKLLLIAFSFFIIQCVNSMNDTEIKNKLAKLYHTNNLQSKVAFEFLEKKCFNKKPKGLFDEYIAINVLYKEGLLNDDYSVKNKVCVVMEESKKQNGNYDL